MPFPSLPQGNPAPDPGQFIPHASGLANALQSAANQKATQLRLQREEQSANAQREFQDQLEIYKAGGQEDAIAGNAMGQAAPGTRVQAPATLRKADDEDLASRQSRKGTTITSPRSGKQYYLPTEQEKGKTFVPEGQLADMLEMAGHKRGTEITPSDSHTVMEALNLAQPKGETFHIDTSGKFLGPDGKPGPAIIGDKTGIVRMLDLSGGGSAFNLQKQGAIPPGTILPPAGTSQGVSFGLPDKPDRPDAQSILPNQQGPNGGILVFDKNTQSVNEVNIPKGSKGVMTEAQKEADKDRDLSRSLAQGERGERRTERQQDKAEAAKKTSRGFEAKKNTANRKAIDAYRKAIAGDPTPGGKKEALANLRSDLDNNQSEYETDVKSETGNEFEHNKYALTFDPDAPAPGTTQMSAPPAKPAKPAEAPAPQQAAKGNVAPEGTVITDAQGQTHTKRGGQWQPPLK
jgi:hypothetical protein